MNHTPTPEAAALPCWLRAHPADWVPGTLDRAALVAEADALRAAPGFVEEAQHFAHCWQAAYDASPTLHAAMRNSPRYLLLVACLRLHHEARRAAAAATLAGAGPEPVGSSGITAARLIALLTGGGRQLASVSPSRVKAMLGHAKALGLLRPAAGTGRGDARLNPLEPTPALEQAMAQWVCGFLRGIGRRLPLPTSAEAMVATPGFVGELFTYRLAGFVDDRFILSEPVPELRWIMDREKGYHLFLSLVRSLQATPDRGWRVQGVQCALAAQARVSRGTVQNLLASCERQGWLLATDEPGHWQLSAPFAEAALRWMGLEFVWMHTLAVLAWHRIRQQQPPQQQGPQEGPQRQGLHAKPQPAPC